MKTPHIARRFFLCGAAAVATAVTPAKDWLDVATGSTATVEAFPAPSGPVDQERWQASLTVARRLMMVGPNGEDLKLAYLKILIKDGLPRPTARKKVLIVGAGIAGLT